jgi:hypothetical protein
VKPTGKHHEVIDGDRKRSTKKKKKKSRGKRDKKSASDEKPPQEEDKSSPKVEGAWSTIKRDIMQIAGIPRGETDTFLDLLFGIGEFSLSGSSDYRLGSDARAQKLSRKLHEAARLYVAKNWKNESFKGYRESVGLNGWSAARKASRGIGLPEGRTTPELTPQWLDVISSHLVERRRRSKERMLQAAQRRTVTETWIVEGSAKAESLDSSVVTAAEKTSPDGSTTSSAACVGSEPGEEKSKVIPISTTSGTGKEPVSPIEPLRSERETGSKRYGTRSSKPHG